MDDQERVKNLLKEAGYMTIALVLDDGTPWAVPVKIQLQQENAFEWDSKTDTEHSKAIEQRPEVMISIWQKTGDTQLGFYAKAEAVLVSENERGTGRYRAVVKRAWVNDQTFIKREVNIY